jgi:hypothetical protein
MTTGGNAPPGIVRASPQPLSKSRGKLAKWPRKCQPGKRLGREASLPSGSRVGKVADRARGPDAVAAGTAVTAVPR